MILRNDGVPTMPLRAEIQERLDLQLGLARPAGNTVRPGTCAAQSTIDPAGVR